MATQIGGLYVSLAVDVTGFVSAWDVATRAAVAGSDKIAASVLSVEQAMAALGGTGNFGAQFGSVLATAAAQTQALKGNVVELAGSFGGLDAATNPESTLRYAQAMVQLQTNLRATQADMTGLIATAERLAVTEDVVAGTGGGARVAPVVAQDAGQAAANDAIRASAAGAAAAETEVGASAAAAVAPLQEAAAATQTLAVSQEAVVAAAAAAVAPIAEAATATDALAVSQKGAATSVEALIAAFTSGTLSAAEFKAAAQLTGTYDASKIVTSLEAMRAGEVAAAASAGTLAASQGAIVPAANAAADALKAEGAQATDTAALNAQASRELLVLFAEIQRGNFNRVPGSIDVLTRSLAASGTGALTFGNVLKLAGSVAATAFNPVVLGVLALSIGFEQVVKLVESVSKGNKTAADTAKEWADNLKSVTDGYDSAAKSATAAFDAANKQPAGAVGSNLEKQQADEQDRLAALSKNLDDFKTHAQQVLNETEGYFKDLQSFGGGVGGAANNATTTSPVLEAAKAQLSAIADLKVPATQSLATIDDTITQLTKIGNAPGIKSDLVAQATALVQGFKEVRAEILATAAAYTEATTGEITKGNELATAWKKVQDLISSGTINSGTTAAFDTLLGSEDAIIRKAGEVAISQAEIANAFKPVDDAITKLNQDTANANFQTATDGLTGLDAEFANAAIKVGLVDAGIKLLQGDLQNGGWESPGLIAFINQIATLEKAINGANGADGAALAKSAATFRAQMASIDATTPDQKRAAAEQQKSASLDGQVISPDLKQQEITQAGELAYASAIKATTAAAAAQEKQIQKVKDSLIEQTAALYETDREQAIATALANAHVTATSKEGQEITVLAGALYDQKKALDDTNQAANFYGQTIESAFEGLITGGQSATDVLNNMWKALANAVIQAELLGSGPLAGILGTSPSTSGGLGGLLGSIGSLFNPGAGAGAGVAGLGVGDNGVIGGFASGGYTGSGGNLEPAGVVHKNEYVFSASATARIGRGRLDALHGYAGGGFVGPASNSNADTLRVEIHNESGQPIAAKSATRSQDASGVDVVKIIVGTMKTAFADGSMDRTMETVYATKRQGR